MALTVFGPAARPAVPALAKALHDENDSIRLMVAVVLLRIDPAHKEALKIANTAAGALTAARPAAPERNQLEAAMEDPALQAYFDRIVRLFITVETSPCQVQEAMMGALDAQINSLPPEAVPALVRGINVIASFQIGFC